MSFTISGSFSNTFAWLRKLQNREAYEVLHAYGREGVAALQAATPVDSGATAAGWGYEIVDEANMVIVWTNTNVRDGFNVAIGIQYGHGTGTGGYVMGRDYINPAIQPVFDKIADRVWKAVTS